MKERKENEEKERKELVKTNLGPEETVETIREQMARERERKKRFKSDVLLQIHVNGEITSGKESEISE